MGPAASLGRPVVAGGGVRLETKSSPYLPLPFITRAGTRKEFLRTLRYIFWTTTKRQKKCKWLNNRNIHWAIVTWSISVHHLWGCRSVGEECARWYLYQVRTYGSQINQQPKCVNILLFMNHKGGLGCNLKMPMMMIVCYFPLWTSQSPS